MVEGLRHYLRKPYSKEVPYSSGEKSYEWAKNHNRVGQNKQDFQCSTWAVPDWDLVQALSDCCLNGRYDREDSGGQTFMFLCCGIHPLQG